MLSVQHDLRHRIAAAEQLLSNMDIQADQRGYAQKLLEVQECNILYFTGNIAADAILKAKSEMMKEAGISFTLTECPLEPLPLPEQDFCVLLSNLLDNAIEGSARLGKDAPSRNVRLSFSRIREMLVITCENDADTEHLKRSGDTFLSGKEQPELHGFGLANMRKTVERAGGMLELEAKNGIFSVCIMFGGVPCADEVRTKDNRSFMGK